MQIPGIDLPTMTCSALLVEPKPPFFEWLAEALQGKLASMTVEEVYFAQEDPVWIIPYVPRFGPGDLGYYLDGLKPELLRFHLSTFVTDIALLPTALDAATFDRFFELKIRNSVKDIRALESK